MTFSLRRWALGAAACGALLWGAPQALAFCGFYVAKADSSLFNEASKVVIARDGKRTVLTMINDYKGEPTEFALVVPTPVVLQKEQVNVGDAAPIDHLDAFTAPRLVEYFDEDPCRPIMYEKMAMPSLAPMAAPAPVAMARSAADLGVKIEASYTVGEYDILILSAKESNGLQIWLDQEGYKVPPKARDVLASYLRQDMKFFVAKVNLKEKAKLGGDMLRPIQIAFEHDRFMLPIRLGTVNSTGKQDLIAFMLSREGRVETTNYRTARIPTGMDLPLYLKDKTAFGQFYKDMFRTTAEREGNAVVLEYAWDMGWCDPCAADPLSQDELLKLGAMWMLDGGGPNPDMKGRRLMPPPPPGGGAQDAYVTRLHVRYDAESFPEDLMFQQTGDRENFQGRYVMRHPFKGDLSCEAGRDYARSLPERFEREAQALSNLTGWDVAAIRQTMAEKGQKAPEVPAGGAPDWWNQLWKK